MSNLSNYYHHFISNYFNKVVNWVKKHINRRGKDKLVSNNTHKNLITLYNAWGELIKKPTELVFAKTIYHDLKILSNIVAERVVSGERFRGWRKDRIVDLHTYLTTLSYEASFIQFYYPHLYRQLINTTTPDSTGRYNANELDVAIGLFVQSFDSVADSSIEEKAKKLSPYMLNSDSTFSTVNNLFFIHQMFDGVTIPQQVIEDLFKASAKNKNDQAEFITQSIQTDFWAKVADQWFVNFATLTIQHFFMHIFVKNSAPQAKILNAGQNGLKEYTQQITDIHTYWANYCSQAAESLFATNLFQDWEHQIPDEALKMMPIFRKTSSGVVKEDPTKLFGNPPTT